MRFSKLALTAVGIVALQIAPVAAQEEVTVQELADRWTAAYNQADVDGIADLYAPDAELYIHNEGRYVGRDAIRDYWIGDVSLSNPITVLNVTDSVKDSEMMLVHGNYQVLDRTNGVPLGAGRFAHIWILGDDGKWHLDRDVWVDRNAM